MVNEPVINRLKRLLAEKLKTDKIPDDEPLFTRNHRLDSVDYLEIIVAIEREFNVSISGRHLKEPEAVFRTVSTLAAFIEQLISSK